jgi:hypothetical protein
MGCLCSALDYPLTFMQLLKVFCRRCRTEIKKPELQIHTSFQAGITFCYVPFHPVRRKVFIHDRVTALILQPDRPEVLLSCFIFSIYELDQYIVLQLLHFNFSINILFLCFALSSKVEYLIISV